MRTKPGLTRGQRQSSARAARPCADPDGLGEARIKAAQSDVRAHRVLEWKEDWCEKHNRFLTECAGPFNRPVKIPDIKAAPEPTDDDLNWPESMISVFWDTGCLTITADAFQKLPVTQRNKILKLGGMK